MSNVDEFYEYAKNNFLNFLNKNDKNENKKKREESKIKGLSDNNVSDIKNLRKEEMNDKESYDKKYTNYLLKKKHRKEEKKNEKKNKKKSSSSDSSSSYTKQDEDKDKKKRKYENYTKRKHEKYKESKYDKDYKKYKYDSDGKYVSYDKEQQKKKKHSSKENEKDEIRKKKKQTKEKNDFYNDSDNSYDNNNNNNNNIHNDFHNDNYYDERDSNTIYKKSYSLSSENYNYDEKQKKDIQSLCNIEQYGNNKEECDTHCTSNLKNKLEKIINERKNQMILKNSLNKNLVDCKYCIDSNSFEKLNKLNIISISNKSYICYYNYKNIFLKDQLFISPIEHTTSFTNTTFDVIQDMRNHMKSLIAMLEVNNQTCIFIEFNNCFNPSIELISMRKTKHTYINCYVIPMDLLEKAKIYFKKNMEEINSLYRENKQLIISDSKYAPYNVIPKNIPYVSVNFSLVDTYIQVIENNYDYINMCRCIFADLFKKDRLYKYFKNFQHYVNSVEEFKKGYEKYDWTNYM
ncbi:putative debranching enzyme-associated ribonuclease [Plasmodium gaboni]|uniref:Putative debranching enzyme-associated ribonuclease n=1 Tax=Plasmodium gaboni TaxID=647221 RepID=A0A151LGM0_9APIC|nr:putative debranching enzyme-associated ribonuclease [Plasmodium gaboni]KYN98009.1 putative debranching enzyme-associated ribonuclease [Plasmodium gaboni]